MTILPSYLDLARNTLDMSADGAIMKEKLKDNFMPIATFDAEPIPIVQKKNLKQDKQLDDEITI